VHPYIPKERTGPVMATAHCALVTLRDDALGVMSPSKIHANLALGLPLIYVGPAKSNVDEAIAGHACGVSLRHGDVDGLVSFVRRMMESGQAHGDLRQRARTAFDAAYCDLATMPRFDAVIEHALTGHSRDPSIPSGTASDYAGAAA
jgi:colanic acid biosynthesis glycosyl transferase WcaI